MEIQDLKPNARNPKKITQEKLDFLRKSLKEFGDLSGVVFNVKNNTLVAGHQRVKNFDKKSKIVVVTKYPKPTPKGTVAEGYVLHEGEKFNYREVSFDTNRHEAAMIAANKLAGEFDPLGLSEIMRSLNDSGFDLDLTMFNETERLNFLTPILDPNADWSKTMPEFIQEDKSAEQQIIVNFKSFKDVVRFGKLIKQNLTDKTRSIWFPGVKRNETKKKKYK